MSERMFEELTQLHMRRLLRTDGLSMAEVLRVHDHGCVAQLVVISLLDKAGHDQASFAAALEDGSWYRDAL